MNITEGLLIKENQFVNWNISFEELKFMCKKTNIDYQSKTMDMLKRVSLPIEFANLGMVQANIYFINDYIKEIYITSETETEFNMDKYLKVNSKLMLYFGTPKYQTKNKTLWEFNKIHIKHFYTKKDDVVMDYLVLENHNHKSFV